MKSIRIGKDILFTWSITTNGENTSLEGRDLKLELISPIGIRKDIPFDIENNTIIFKFLGIDQKMFGVYGITLWENYGLEGQTVVDIGKAFKLVDSTEKEN